MTSTMGKKGRKAKTSTEGSQDERRDESASLLEPGASAGDERIAAQKRRPESERAEGPPPPGRAEGSGTGHLVSGPGERVGDGETASLENATLRQEGASDDRSRATSPGHGLASGDVDAAKEAKSADGREALADAHEASAGQDANAGQDTTIPPIDLDSRFFSEGFFANDGVLPEERWSDFGDEPIERDPRMVLKNGPAAARRRATFQKYVQVAVGAASVLCAVALFKAATVRRQEDARLDRMRPSSAVALVQGTGDPGQSAVDTVAPGDTTPTRPAEAGADLAAAAAAEITAAKNDAASSAAAAELADAQVVPSAATEPSVENTAPAAERGDAGGAIHPLGQGDPTSQADTVGARDAAAGANEANTQSELAARDGGAGVAADGVPDPKAAMKEKRASQAALERGNVSEAIAAGERSVALDRTDAEAWLILGAAYQQKGDFANARRSFKSCLTETTHGPKWDCAQMPH